MSQFYAVLFLCLSFLFPVLADTPPKLKISNIITKNRFPGWMAEQIASDLASFAPEDYSKQALDNFMDQQGPDSGFVRFQVKDGVVDVDMKCHLPLLVLRATVLERAFKWLAKEIILPDLDFICTVHDGSLSDFSVPVLVFAKKKTSKHLLMPDFEILEGYGELSRSVLAAGSVILWNQKKPVAFWRGSTTGGIYTEVKWAQFPRSQLVLLSVRYPRKINARFTCFSQGAEHNEEMRGIPQLLGNRVSPADSLQYKYLIDIDGNNCGYQRLYWTLLSSCAVFKQVSDNVQWYYSILKPYEHYIPFANDCSDLIEKVDWAREHDQEVKKNR